MKSFEEYLDGRIDDQTFWNFFRTAAWYAFKPIELELKTDVKYKLDERIHPLLNRLKLNEHYIPKTLLLHR